MLCFLLGGRIHSLIGVVFTAREPTHLTEVSVAVLLHTAEMKFLMI